MTFASAPARWLGSLAFGFLSCVGAQTLPSDPAAQGSWEASSQLPVPQRFEQAWDVVELLGQPMLSDAQRPARVLLRPQGGLWVDGGCNYFSGRIERDAQGLFRVYKYGGTHGGCEKPPRSEALLNSALVMVDNYRWDSGLLLRSGDNDLIRLTPSANQDGQDIEQALENRAAPAAAPAPAQQAVERNCRQVKTKVRKGSKLITVTRPVCKPVKATTAKVRKAKPTAQAKSSRPASRSKPASRNGR